jgi:protocatechuate 3,4-dioxygenase, alpha subunit
VVNGAITHDPTPGQTVGPFFGMALPDPELTDLVAPDHPDAVTLTGVVLDGDGVPVPDALLEVWQPRSSGGARWGRCATDVEGRYRFRISGEGEWVTMVVFARGLTDKLITRAYLTDPAEDALWAVLAPEQRDTLRVSVHGNERHFDIRLQGADETVFLVPRQD